MIVVCFGDGLGNQMFQYALYRAMTKRYTNCKIVADIGNIYGKIAPHNGFELERVFGIKLPECSKMKALALVDYYPALKTTHPFFSRILGVNRLFRDKKESFILPDDPTAFYSEIFELNPLNDFLLRGNWINENYFRDIKKELISSFEFPDIDEKNGLIREKIETTNSVSIHVRRGDYLNSDLYNLKMDYYRKAIDTIQSKEKENMSFFVFSDDLDFCREQFDYLDDVYFVQGNTGKEAYIDMQLMSLCKHNIIANSTFSFWGAFLNKNEGKIVVAPNKASDSFINPIACDDWILM